MDLKRRIKNGLMRFRLVFIYSLLLCLSSLESHASVDTDSIKANKKWGPYLKQFDFKAHDIVLSLGCGGAWREFELSLLTDSITFYLEDIDSLALNTKSISTKINEFKNNRKRPLNNNFHIVYGTTEKIPVNDQLCNKVLIMNSFHHFDNKEMMLGAINRVLLPQGKLIITDHISLDVSKESSYGCDRKYFLLNEKDLITLIEKSNFKLVSVTKMAKQTRQFVFEKN
jgi:ubiquinone/menaquinone biosynthesis C-methylase UbiE